MNEMLSSVTPVWSVSELNRAVKRLLESELPLLWVSGEISNLTIAASGHCYLSLKDAGAQVRCVMFRNRAMLLPFKLREGMKVEARAVVTLYEARGDYQLNLESMRPAGLGALFEAFEKLKLALAAEGLFDLARKRLLPANPRAIGVITSPKAAALRDVLSTLRRRAPHVPVVFYPTPVQGEGAADAIAAMLAKANARGEVDVLILCRGGGSIEDLWSFNEELVARAIAVSTIPVVSGVGHETDFTIADFVADVRAPTPTAAAELVSVDRESQLAAVKQLHQRLQRLFRQQLEGCMQRLDYMSRRLVHPGERLKRQALQLQDVAQALRRSMARVMEQKRWQLLNLRQQHSYAKPGLAGLRTQLAVLQQRRRFVVQGQQSRAAAQLATVAARLEALNPTAVLGRGYSLVETTDGKLVREAAGLRNGQKLRLRFAQSEAGVVVGDVPVEQGNLF
ncbi:exodeoxyribonuclease VII large subunit [Chitinimonas sp. BJB300]|uniref:exodeoxyribonuclease VII large subunit n=1 Tax=Chitinimonas sp. BJB300 TaxID=1559339 RepID=UPI000C0F6E40|nr:exodeoxyribonuclease VII large subunit [Chitinimonas sp. BJB300]PHV10707.1 exodeoxyribonuclease VII large subunit [Chitinimonas sp. BJB300]TSJ89778.1 exodeoxyribonuclease VII large subunit [Chitinimonas sp. BJB300]